MKNYLRILRRNKAQFHFKMDFYGFVYQLKAIADEGAQYKFL